MYTHDFPQHLRPLTVNVCILKVIHYFNAGIHRSHLYLMDRYHYEHIASPEMFLFLCDLDI